MVEEEKLEQVDFSDPAPAASTINCQDCWSSSNYGLASRLLCIRDPRETGHPAPTPAQHHVYHRFLFGFSSSNHQPPVAFAIAQILQFAAAVSSILSLAIWTSSMSPSCLGPATGIKAAH